jgi:hypothetical protein
LLRLRFSPLLSAGLSLSPPLSLLVLLFSLYISFLLLLSLLSPSSFSPQATAGGGDFEGEKKKRIDDDVNAGFDGHYQLQDMPSPPSNPSSSSSRATYIKKRARVSIR